jgi:hypothetical protein
LGKSNRDYTKLVSRIVEMEPPIHITDIKNISPLIQLLDKIAKQQYEIIALTDNKVKVQPKTA